MSRTPNEDREELVNVGFKAGPDTLDDIDELLAACPPGVVAKKSVVIRKAIKEAADRVRMPERKPLT